MSGSDGLLQRAEAWLDNAWEPEGAPRNAAYGLIRDLAAALREARIHSVRKAFLDMRDERDEARRERDAALARVKWCDDGRHQAFPDAFMSCPDHNERAERAEAERDAAREGLRKTCEFANESAISSRKMWEAEVFALRADLATAEGLLARWVATGDPAETEWEVYDAARAFLDRREGKGTP